MRRTPTSLLVPLLLAACGGAAQEPEPPSDPTDYFYRNQDLEGITNPPIRWQQREPGRLFETTLRPTALRGALPSTYLSRITRNYQPWAEQIYDVADVSFDYFDITPLPPERGIGWGILGTERRNEILIDLGGYATSYALEPQALANLRKGTIETRGHHTVVVADLGGDEYFFSAPDASNLDGQPVWVECYRWKCEAALTIPQEMAGLNPLHEGRSAPVRGTTGARLAITFHPDLIDDWPEVRRKAVCFAALSIPDLDADLIEPAGRLRCDDLRTAIASTMTD